MATPADQRLLELLEKWLKSLELHLRYSSLDADSYSKIQPWPEHQRPSRWIIDLAMQKALALRAQVQERIKMGDAKFSDSLELMTFLANLIGSEHIERFIPLADPAERARACARAGPHLDTRQTTRHDGHARRHDRRRAKCRNSSRPNAKPRRPWAPRKSPARSANRAPPSRQQKPRPNNLLNSMRPQGTPPPSRRASEQADGRRRSGGRARTGHRRCGAVGAVGTQMVRTRRTHRTHGRSAAVTRSATYTKGQ